MARGATASPNPNLLIWARTSAGISEERAAKRLQVSVDAIQQWERGSANPTFSQLRRISEVYKRPLPVFYLEEPPIVPDAPVDFRTHEGLQAADDRPAYSPELLYEIRRSRTRRAVALELFSDADEPPPSFDLDISETEDSEEAALRIRNYLGIAVEDQSRWKPASAFSRWRTLLESHGLITCQARGIPQREARGFSIKERPLPVITVNNKDSANGRIFTLLHELAHVSLRTAGICDLHEVRHASSEEAFCNRVAGAVIFPAKEFFQTEIVRSHPRGLESWSDLELEGLARRFGASREAVLVRLLILNLTAQDYFREKRDQIIKSYKQPSKRNVVVPHHVVEAACAGELFISRVSKSYSRQLITLRDASLYLNIDSRHTAEMMEFHQSTEAVSA